MPGATIDHLISVTLFLVAVVLFISLFSQNIQSALLYQRYQQVSIKAGDLLDAMTLNTGYAASLARPTFWGSSNATPTSFGLQDPTARGYHLSPFSLMRLNSSSGTPVYYEKTGLYYSNVSMGWGGYLLVPYTSVVPYTTASKLLGINGSYGFQLTISPILKITMAEIPSDHARVSVSVTGPGLPLANAYLAYNLIFANNSQKQYPIFSMFTGVARTSADGTAILDFPGIRGTQFAYALIVNAYLGGLYGVGFFEHQYIDDRFVVPFVKNLDNGNGTATILLAHSYDIHMGTRPNAAIFYNATFLLLTSDAQFHPIFIGNGTINGKVNYGWGKPYGEVLIPSMNPGILVTTFSYGTNYGISLLPWGLGNLGATLVYGPPPSVKDWIATDVRQVVVAGVSYQIKISLWSLAGYQTQGSRWVI